MSARERPSEGLLAGTPVGLLLALALVLALAGGLTAAAALPPPALRVVAVTAGHAALLGTALAWAAHDGRVTWNPRRAIALGSGLLALGALGRWLGLAGAVLSLAVPVWFAALGLTGRLAPLGVRLPRPPAAGLVGAAAGALLGAHLLLTASRTLGYQLRGDGLAPWGAAFAYDLGANVLVTESFCRGALFGRVWRRESFAAGAVVSTAACVARYVADPLLPKTVEVLVGTMLYVTLLSLANAWLRAWSGSLLPGIAGALVFFAAWRALTVA